MTSQIPLLVAQASDFDSGVKKMAQISARLAYVLMCATLSWGVLIATGWAQKLTGREGLKNGHMVLASLAIAFGALHAFAFSLLRDGNLGFIRLVLPFVEGGFFRHALGIVGLELMAAIAIFASVRHKVFYRKWLRFHQTAYIAVALTVVHSWFGAIANGNLSITWLGGLTVLVPTATLALARFLPPEMLTKIGMLEPEPGNQGDGDAMDVSVNNEKCHRYGTCQAEAPDVFQLIEDNRLTYNRRPPEEHFAQARAAARACPMRAIDIKERVR
ncbi:ferredoxin [Lentzea sp. NBRC 105346]|uniref:ferric reductase-like transmembrane domain-containing protein n=1 Tax=Lentzea sp. NBRC 105346 TaxID=3032205 RepID=UPI0024A1D9EA|nr:ferric reductase-like transmembrane domain-containing protein [Lentzea sp. NBRC 105346]GLZ33713.1 ferredoxin [Lentzea sp. NBRC 105346]